MKVYYNFIVFVILLNFQKSHHYVLSMTFLQLILLLALETAVWLMSRKRLSEWGTGEMGNSHCLTTSPLGKKMWGEEKARRDNNLVVYCKIFPLKGREI